MKIYNTPKEARGLREIEAAAMSPIVKTIKAVHGTIQPLRAAEKEAPKEARSEAKTKKPSKKERKKKEAEDV